MKGGSDTGWTFPSCSLKPAGVALQERRREWMKEEKQRNHISPLNTQSNFALFFCYLMVADPEVALPWVSCHLVPPLPIPSVCCGP